LLYTSQLNNLDEDSPSLERIETLEAFEIELANLAIQQHQTFETTVWQQNLNSQITVKDGETEHKLNPSYHNVHHIKSVVKAVDVVFEGWINGLDPFHLRNEILRWNTINPENQITEKELYFALKFLAYTHDQGNLTKGSGIKSITENGVELDFSDKYEAEPVETEKRSVNIFKAQSAFLQRKATDEVKSQLAKIESLTEYLIMKTVFNPQKTTFNDPFEGLVESLDQIGGYSYLEVSSMSTVNGLINEMRVRNALLEPENLLSFLGFVPWRLSLIFPDTEQRKEVVALFAAKKGTVQDSEFDVLVFNHLKSMVIAAASRR
jgi:hypothetical protein